MPKFAATITCGPRETPRMKRRRKDSTGIYGAGPRRSARLSPSQRHQQDEETTMPSYNIQVNGQRRAVQGSASSRFPAAQASKLAKARARLRRLGGRPAL